MSISLNARKSYGWLAAGTGLGFTGWRLGFSVSGVMLSLAGAGAVAKGVHMFTTQVALPLCKYSIDGIKSLKNRSRQLDGASVFKTQAENNSVKKAPPSEWSLARDLLPQDDGSILGFMFHVPRPPASFY